MKKTMLTALAATVALAASAQSAIDAYQISQNDLKGTARFMSMAGAFGALGGDLSTLTQNPGGIGVYRSSEIGVTVDFNFQKTNTNPVGISGWGDKYTQTKVYCNNFGYVGAVDLNNDVMPYFNWGASYTRAVSFDRVYQGWMPQLNGSLTNYVANYTTADNYTQADLSQSYYSNYNPYQASWAPWMSILFYNNYLINPSGNGYVGLYDGTAGTGDYMTREKGYVDEYSINFGGNICNTLYWGIGFGITDIDYKSDVYYAESFSSARVPTTDATATTDGSAEYSLNSWKHIYGTGFNFKCGVILKPINELRLGLAVHTPTYYKLSQEGFAQVDYYMSTGYYPTSNNSWMTGTNEGYADYFEWKSRTPWRLIASAAGVIGGKFIISGDYEYRPYQDMYIANNDGDEYYNITGDVKNYYQAANIVRLGAEYRVTPQVSVRAGYSYESTPVTSEMRSDKLPVYTSGQDDTETTPSYTNDKSTQYITCGIGYKYKSFYVDAAYVHKHRRSTYHGFTPMETAGGVTGAPVCDVKDDNNSLVISIGFRF